jgi:hypothetical protein
MRRLRAKLTYANVISTLCLVLLVAGGTAYAATKLPKNSVGARQLKKGAVTAAKLSKSAAATLTGPRGPQGAKGEIGPTGSAGQRGEQGPVGPSAAYSTFHDASISITANSENPHLYATLGNLPAGSYTVEATFIATSETTTPNILFCELRAGADVDEKGVSPGRGAGDAWLESVAMQVVHVFDTPGSVELWCGQAQGSGMKIQNVKITATRVGELSNTGF